jgi:hypothetical protein
MTRLFYAMMRYGTMLRVVAIVAAVVLAIAIPSLVAAGPDAIGP